MNSITNRFISAFPIILLYSLSHFNTSIRNISFIFLVIVANIEYFNNFIKISKSKILLNIYWLILNLSFYFATKLNPILVLNIVSVNIFSDGFQYLFGKTLNKYLSYKPFKNISPNKTLVGYIFGLLVTFILVNQTKIFTKIQIILILLSGVFGDLFESFIKRKINIKDFSITYNNKSINLLGKHGGVLDRIDSIIFSVLSYYLILN